MKFRTLLFATMLMLAGAAIGANPPPPASTGATPMDHREGPCKKDPAKCQAAAAKFDQWCSANAEKCTDLKAWAERRREYCEAHGQECKDRMHNMHEHMKEYCSKNPDDVHCKAMKDPHDEGDTNDMPPPPK